MEQMRSAAPCAISVTKEQWLAARGTSSAAPGHQRRSADSGHGAAAAAEQPLARLPVKLPEQPRGFVMRESVTARAREALLGKQGEEAPRLCDQTPTLLLQGMVSACVRACGRASGRACTAAAPTDPHLPPKLCPSALLLRCVAHC